MAFSLAFAVLIAIASCQELAPSNTKNQYPLGDSRNCPVNSPQDDNQPLNKIEVLPGIGFDNLRNLDMGQVHAYSYSSCKVSNNDRLLLPDNVFLIPVQESRVEVFSEYIDHWDNQTSMTSNSINVEANLFSKISGRFSSEYTTTKSHMYRDRAKSTRVQIRHKLYTIKMQPGAPLHPKFIDRMFDIGSNIQNNNTEYASYLAELTIREYGTHFISSVVAGGVLSQSDFIQFTEEQDMSQQIRSVKAAASFNFFSKLSLNTTFQHNSSEANTRGFLERRTNSLIVTVGGPSFIPGLTLEQWAKGVEDKPVAIDRIGVPLYYAITPNTLPSMLDHTRNDVGRYLELAINHYYEINTRHGCIDPAAANFDFHANLGDSMCRPPSTNYSFGGLYQTCRPDPYHNRQNLCEAGERPARQLNPITGGYTCPRGYTAINLHSGSISNMMGGVECIQSCESCGFLWLDTCCSCNYVSTTFTSVAHYETYWCTALNSSQVRSNEGYLFGGFYSSTVSNPVTSSMSCPPSFYPLRMAADIAVCVSSDYELGFAYAVNFAGFDSCSVGNPLAHTAPTISNQNQWPNRCPSGYARHLITMQDGCAINFCVQAGAFKPNALNPAILPPFFKNPIENNNSTGTLVMIGARGVVWERNGEGWNAVNLTSEEGKELLTQLNLTVTTPLALQQSSSSNGSGLSKGGVAAISIVMTAVLGVVIIIVVYVVHKVRKRVNR